MPRASAAANSPLRSEIARHPLTGAPVPVWVGNSAAAWYLLAGALWDVVVAYGSGAQDIIEQDYFRMRVRHLINTALDAVDPLQP